MLDIRLTGVVKYGGKWREPGNVLHKVDEEIGNDILAAGVGNKIETQEGNPDSDHSSAELQTLRERAKELGVQNAGRLGEAKLKEGIAEKEAELKLKELQEKAFELGIADAYEKDAASLAKEIEAAEQK